MGAWGIGSFENDDAADWLYDLEKSKDASVVAAALQAVTDTDDEYVEAPVCCNAIAASEIVAALLGRPISKIPDNARNWVDAHRKLDVTSLVPLAKMALDQIRTESELKELWAEVNETTQWLVTIDDLTQRLGN